MYVISRLIYMPTDMNKSMKLVPDLDILSKLISGAH